MLSCSGGQCNSFAMAASVTLPENQNNNNRAGRCDFVWEKMNHSLSCASLACGPSGQQQINLPNCADFLATRHKILAGTKNKDDKGGEMIALVGRRKTSRSVRG